MTFNELLQLNMPHAFPSSNYAGFMSAARTVLLPATTDTWKEFAGASNLIGWRFRASFEGMNRYIKSWQRHGSTASFEELYLRERALFGMFSCGVSCLESTCYASYALASHPTVLNIHFEQSEKRHCKPVTLIKALDPFPRAKPLTTALINITQSTEWELWTELRNRMTHRSDIPRATYGAMGSTPPPAEAQQFAATSSTSAFEANENYLKILFSSLVQHLTQILNGGQHLALRSGLNQ